MGIVEAGTGAFIGEKVNYERRVVAFYDVMGWQNKIVEAGNDIEKITTLKNVVRIFSTAMMPENKDKWPFDFRQSTFSDNVVVSAVVEQQSVFNFLLRLGFTQLLSAYLGFFIRGGVTVGDIVHDEHVVFGPALNRAYQLEKEVADKPRIVLDPECMDPLGGASAFGSHVVTEDGVMFLDPWTRNTAGALWMITSAAQNTSIQSPDGLLAAPLFHVMNELKGPLEEKNKVRLTWLQNRILAGLQPNMTK
jgi:hypothetical protein